MSKTMALMTALAACMFSGEASAVGNPSGPNPRKDTVICPGLRDDQKWPIEVPEFSLTAAGAASVGTGMRKDLVHTLENTGCFLVFLPGVEHHAPRYQITGEITEFRDPATAEPGMLSLTRGHIALILQIRDGTTGTLRSSKRYEFKPLAFTLPGSIFLKKVTRDEDLEESTGTMKGRPVMDAAVARTISKGAAHTTAYILETLGFPTSNDEAIENTVAM